MVLPNKVVLLLGVVLAVANALISYFFALGDLSIVWSAALSAVILIVAVFGVQLLSPSAISAQIPAHWAAAAAAALTGLNSFLLTVSVPPIVHIIFGAVLAIAGALGIVVTGVQFSAAAKRLVDRSLA